MSDTPRTDDRTYSADCLGKTLVVNADWARVLERENVALQADKKRFEWLCDALEYGCSIGDADPTDHDIEGRSITDAWRAAIDAARKEGGAS